MKALRSWFLGACLILFASHLPADEKKDAEVRLIIAPATSEEFQSWVPLEETFLRKGVASSPVLTQTLRKAGILHDDQTTVRLTSGGSYLFVTGSPAEVATLQALLDKYHGKRLEEKILQLTPDALRALRRDLAERGGASRFEGGELDCQPFFRKRAGVPTPYFAAVLATDNGKLLVRGSSAEIARVELALRDLTGDDPILHAGEKSDDSTARVLVEQQVIDAAVLQLFGPPSAHPHVVLNAAPADAQLVQATKDAFVREARGKAAPHDPAFAEALTDFVLNDSPYSKVTSPDRTPRNFTVIEPRAFNALIFGPTATSENSWKKFYQRYPGSEGLIEVSRVGLDSAFNVAILYLSLQSSNHPATARIYVFKFDGETWQRIKSLNDLTWAPTQTN